MSTGEPGTKSSLENCPEHLEATGLEGFKEFGGRCKSRCVFRDYA